MDYVCGCAAIDGGSAAASLHFPATTEGGAHANIVHATCGGKYVEARKAD